MHVYIHIYIMNLQENWRVSIPTDVEIYNEWMIGLGKKLLLHQQIRKAEIKTHENNNN